MLLPQTTTIPTEPDHKPQQQAQPASPYTSSPPGSLIALLVFVILQCLFAIAVLVLKIVFVYYGFNQVAALRVDPTCGNYGLMAKYEANQLYIMKISLIMVAVCIALSLVELGIVSKAVHESKKTASPLQTNSPSLTLIFLYLIIGHRTRALLYILQSICLLTSIVVLGYYLTFFIQALTNSCSWTSADTSIRVLILWVLCAALFVAAWVVWVIVVLINVKNRADVVYLDDAKPQTVQYQNVNTTEMNTTNFDNTRKEIQPAPKDTDAKTGFNRYMPPEDKPATPIQKVRTLDSEQDQKYAIRVPGSSQAQYYHSPNTPKNQNNMASSKVNYNDPRTYENPVFNSRKDLYESPYGRIENGKYYQGEREKNNNEIRAQMKAIEQHDKDKEFKRSRFNANGHEYDNSYSQPIMPKDDDPYYRSLSRYRLQQEEKGVFKPQQSRQILPEGNRSPTGSSKFEGGIKPKLHSTYFKDETSMLNKKRFENSDEKKKRKGILTDYIRGKYGDN